MPHHPALNVDIEGLGLLSRAELRALWTQVLAEKPPPCLGRDVLALGIAHAMQERRYGGLTKAVSKELDRLLAQVLGDAACGTPPRPASPLPRTGTVLVREWQGTTHQVTVLDDGFLWNGQTHRSLSGIACAITGAKWNGPRFFGMRAVSVSKTPERRHGVE
jgi:Protein of unknown function (DUF2924)